MAISGKTVGKKLVFNPEAFLAKKGRTLVEVKQGDTIFTQGDDSNAVFYLGGGIRSGRISGS